MAKPDDLLDLSDDETAVLNAVARLESSGEAGHLQQVAAESGLRQDRTREVLSSLINRFDLVTEVADTDQPDFGPRYLLQSSD